MANKLVPPLAVLLLLSLVACSPGPNGPGPDKIIYNANIVTLDSQSSIAEAAAIRDGRFVAVGTTAEILELAGVATEQIDMAGRTIVPGLSDNHFHSIGGGDGVDLSQARSLEDVHDAITERVAQTEPGGIIVTNSDWHEGQLAEQRLPYRLDLDRAAPDNPVVVVRGGHEYVLNSAALARWNITASTPEPEGGVIGRDERGRLNGELVDRAKGLVRLPRGERPEYEEQIQALVDEHRRLNEAGLTSVRYGSGSPGRYRMLLGMKERGLLTIRVSTLLRLGGSTDPATLSETFSEWGIDPDDGDEWVRVAGIKLGVDGGFEGGWMREPYEEPWGQNGAFKGLQTFGTEPYIALVRALNQQGWRVATHAVGDAAIDLVLEAYEAAHRDSPITGKRWAIEHGFVPQPDQFPRMKELGLHISAQDHLYLRRAEPQEVLGQQTRRLGHPGSGLPRRRTGRLAGNRLARRPVPGHVGALPLHYTGHDKRRRRGGEPADRPRGGSASQFARKRATDSGRRAKRIDRGRQAGGSYCPVRRHPELPGGSD